MYRLIVVIGIGITRTLLIADGARIPSFRHRRWTGPLTQSLAGTTIAAYPANTNS
jgi:hypothetical protein